jgi:hypothetical protein
VASSFNLLLIACPLVISELRTYALIGSWLALEIACINLSSINEFDALFTSGCPPPDWFICDNKPA